MVNIPQLNPGSEPDLLKSPNKVYDDLLAHRDVVCVPYQRLSDARYFQWCQWPPFLLRFAVRVLFYFLSFVFAVRGCVFLVVILM